MRGSLYVDPTGAWGGQLIAVTTNGWVYSISNTGVPKFIANTGNNVHLEGMITVPNDVGKYGKLAGKIVAGDEEHKRLWTFAADGAKVFYDIPVAVEDLGEFLCN